MSVQSSFDKQRAARGKKKARSGFLSSLMTNIRNKTKLGEIQGEFLILFLGFSHEINNVTFVIVPFIILAILLFHFINFVFILCGYYSILHNIDYSIFTMIIAYWYILQYTCIYYHCMSLLSYAFTITYKLMLLQSVNVWFMVCRIGGDKFGRSISIRIHSSSPGHCDSL